jgi:hypothetical protein
MVTMTDMGQPGRYPLDEYVTSIESGLTPQPESERSGVLSNERAAELGERLRQLHSARQLAESESRDYPVS